jgi:Peptidase C13 family
LWSVLKLAARAALWRTTSEPRLVGFPSLLGWAVALALVRITQQYALAGASPSFTPYGLNAIVAWLAIELAVAALFVPAAGRATALAAMVALSIFADVMLSMTQAITALIWPTAAADVTWHGRAGAFAGAAAIAVWWIVATVAVLLSVAPQNRLVAFGRIAALCLVLLAAGAVFPDAPVFVARDFDARNANLWEYMRARPAAPTQQSRSGPEQDSATQEDAARFEATQGDLLRAEVAHLVTGKKGATNVYAIGIDGWADQDVFIKELDGGLAVLSALLPIRDRTLRLVNHRETLESTPLATQKNFTAAVHAVGEAMDKSADVLVLIMTSHGERTGFALRLPSEVTSELTPREVAATLDQEGIKNRLVIVSACFSGIFVPPLANDDTIVLTASDAEHTSFGCAAEREWTYFGDAFFRQSLRPGTDLRRAFDNARVLISGWEIMDRAAPSNPQGHFGPALLDKLAPFFAPTASAKQ